MGCPLWRSCAAGLSGSSGRSIAGLLLTGSGRERTDCFGASSTRKQPSRGDVVIATINLLERSGIGDRMAGHDQTGHPGAVSQTCQSVIQSVRLDVVRRVEPQRANCNTRTSSSARAASPMATASCRTGRPDATSLLTPERSPMRSPSGRWKGVGCLPSSGQSHFRTDEAAGGGSYRSRRHAGTCREENPWSCPGA